MNEYYGDDPGVAKPADGGLLPQLPSILWQRKWYFIIPVILAAVGALAAVLILPREYESGATLLVQAPTLPNEVIGSGDDSEMIDRRIEQLRQQVISRPKLLALIEANELYGSERARKSLSSIIEKMRDDISLTSMGAELNARPEDRTIAFRLNYRYEDPRKAQTIAQSLMEQVVELNSTADVAQANQTVQFLKEQQNELKGAIAAQEQQIGALNARFGGVLARAGSPVMGGSGGYDVQIAELNRSNSMLQMQRRNLKTDDTRDPVVAGAEQGLASARAVYAESHPDVVIAKQRLEEAKKLAAQNVKKMPSENIDEQIAFNNQQIASLRAARATDQSAAMAAAASQSQAPAVQQQASQLQFKLDALYKQNDALSQRLMTAEASARAANEQLGERLVVVDPPVVPDEPASPNRLKITGIALAAGLGLGLVLAFAVEMFLNPIRTPGRVQAITGAPTLALIPVIEPRDADDQNGRTGLFKRIFRNPFRRSKGEFA